MAESAEENDFMVVNVSGPTTTVLLNPGMSFSETAGWDPTLSVDWSKETPSPQCLMRIKRYFGFKDHSKIIKNKDANGYL